MNNLQKISIAVFMLLGLKSAQAQVDACSIAAPSLVFTAGVACVTGTTVGATADFGNASYCTANPNGGGVVNRDVWYKFTTPATLSGCWTFNLERGTAQGDLMLRVFTSCSTVVAGTNYVCSTNNFADLSSSAFTPAAWTTNTTYYIQITARSTTANAGTFNLCVTQSAPQASNDACATPLQITPVAQQTGNNTAGCTYTYNAAADANVAPAQLCALSFENIAWYSFTAQANGTVVINFTNIQCNGGAFGFQLGVFTGTCSSLGYLGCATAGGGNVNLTITGAVAGQQFLMALDGDAGSNCHFNIAGTNVLPLPIELLSFSGEQVDQGNLLEWTTGTEVNNDFFTIEKSRNGFDFEPIGSRKGAGNSTAIIDYKFLDSNTAAGAIYYRIRQTDYDGSFTYSNPIAINVKSKFDQLNISPNPIVDKGNVSFYSDVDGHAELTIINVLGQIKLARAYSLVEGLNNFDLAMQNLESGMYFIQIRSNDKLIQSQFLKR